MMNEILRQVGKLLEQFEASGWRDLYMRSASLSLFMAKNSGSPNPMLAFPNRQASASPPAGATTVHAPHLGTIASTLQPGNEVLPGAIVVQIEILGELVQIASEQSGIVETVLAPVGSLVEYDAPLLSIRPRSRA